MSTLQNETLLRFCAWFSKILLKTYVKSCLFDHAAAVESGENSVSFSCESNLNYKRCGLTPTFRNAAQLVWASITTSESTTHHLARQRLRPVRMQSFDGYTKNFGTTTAATTITISAANIRINGHCDRGRKFAER